MRRRSLLAALPGTGLVLLAGCSGSASSDDPGVRRCSSDDVTHGAGDLLNGGVQVADVDGNAAVLVPIPSDRVEDVSRLVVEWGGERATVPVEPKPDTTTAGASRFPVDGPVYHQRLGDPGWTGSLTVTAYGTDDAVLDSFGFSWECEQN
ncbi:hypothetical protein [Haloarchaeobius sp. DT45]|uniref:hypothetical protein n=1 Tax=Haloarchaeobius sp. DT45 TaxID=3446116 RepID=UPI003F6C9814